MSRYYIETEEVQETEWLDIVRDVEGKIVQEDNSNYFFPETEASRPPTRDVGYFTTVSYEP